MGILKKLIEAWRSSRKSIKVLVVIAAVLGIQLGLLGLVHSIGGNIIEAPRDFVEHLTGEVEAVGTVETTGPLKVDYSEFMGLVKDGAISEATISPSKVEAVGRDGAEIVLNHDRWLYHPSFPRELSDAGVHVKFPDDEPSVLSVFGKVASILFPVAMLVLFAFIGFVFWMQMKSVFTPGWPKIAPAGTVRFSDVAGQDEPKFELEEIKSFLKDPEAYDRVAAKPPRGVIMVGPPGTGKTLLARALAGEAGANFISVSGSDFSASFIGVGRNRIEKLFKEARKRAPCIIFIDEIDSLARKRGASGSDLSRESDTTLNQLLVEMDGFKTKDGIIVIAATNRIDVLDEAVLRPGRFDRHVQVGLPSLAGRRDILAVHTKDHPLADDVDLNVVARGTPGFSGADLANIVNEAAILAAREGVDKITAAHIEGARDKIIMGLQRRSLALSEDERNLIAVHEAGHAVIACLEPASDPVHQATIIPRGRALGLVMRLPIEDRVTIRRAKLKADLAVLMAGRAAEEIVLGVDQVSNGAASDIEEATKIARNMVTRWGMSERIGMMCVPSDNTGRHSPAIEEEIRTFIETAYISSRTKLTDNRAALDALTDALLEHETLDGDRVRKIVKDTAA